MAQMLVDGFLVWVDDEDLRKLQKRTWHVVQTPGRAPYVYAKTTIDGRPGIVVLMHREVLGLTNGDPQQVDHHNGDAHDNRKENLRLATTSQNQANRKRLTLNTSGYRGVTFHRQTQRWQAGIKQNGKSFHLGLHDSPEDAAQAYDQAARRMFGEFANLNFPEAEA